MFRRGREVTVAVLFVVVALLTAPASADPIGSCQQDGRNLGSFTTPCTIGSVVLEGQRASIGGLDVTHAPNLSMSFNFDAYPPEAHWVWVGIPGPGVLPLDPSPTTPLEVRYRMSALAGATLSVLDLNLTNAVHFGFIAPVEFFLAFDNGQTASWTLQGASDRAFGTAPPGATSMDVRIRMFGTRTQGSVAAGVFAGTQAADPAPVPEPGTLALLGSGLALAMARYRKRS